MNKLPLIGGLQRALLAVATILLTAGSCFNFPPAEVVPFPDDPRVLHGEWEMDLLLEHPALQSFTLLPEEDLLILWAFGSVSAYELDSGGDWVERDATPLFGRGGAPYDAALRALVAYHVSESAVTFHIVPINGDPVSDTIIDMPAGLRLSRAHAANGQVFIAGYVGDTPYLYWWDAVTGEPLGEHVIVAAGDGTRVNSNGRAISFVDVPSGTITVVDAIDPQRVSIVGPGICASNLPQEVSADGRWLAVRDCSGDLRIYDLYLPETSWTIAGTREASDIRFAADSPELLWLDPDRHLFGYDVVTRSQERLYPRGSSAGDPVLNSHFTLYRGAGLVIVSLVRGQLELQDLADGSPGGQLPPTAAGTALLDLVAVMAQDGAGSGRYEFSGTVAMPPELGWPEELAIEGEVSATGIHSYQPAQLGAQMQPPFMYIDADLFDPAGGEDPVLTYEYGSVGGPSSAEYRGSLANQELRMFYRAVLKRPGN